MPRMPTKQPRKEHFALYKANYKHTALRRIAKKTTSRQEVARNPEPRRQGVLFFADKNTLKYKGFLSFPHNLRFIKQIRISIIIPVLYSNYTHLHKNKNHLFEG